MKQYNTFLEFLDDMDSTSEYTTCPNCGRKEFHIATRTCEACGYVDDDMGNDTDFDQDLSDDEDEINIDDDVNEALSLRGRLSLSKHAHKRKAKLTLGRKKAKRRTASFSELMGRASRRARRTLERQLSGGTFARDRASHAGLNRMQTMVSARSGQLDMLRRKLLSKARRDDRRKPGARRRKSGK